MPLLISKPKTKLTDDSKTVVVGNEVSQNAALIDEVGALQDDLDVLRIKLVKGREQISADIVTKSKELMAKTKALKAAVADELSEKADDGTFDVLGSDYKVQAGKKGNERKVDDMRLLHQLIDEVDPAGDGSLFYKLCSFGLGDADKYLTPEQKELVISTSRVAREIKLVRRS